MTNHARKAAEEISRWVCSVIVKYDGPISHFDGSNPFEQIIAPHFSTAIADATAEQGRRAEELIAKWRAEADQQQQWQETLVMGALRRVADELEAALNT
jgi:hypothetical protein